MGFLRTADVLTNGGGVAAALVCLVVWILFSIHQRRQSRIVKLPPGPLSLPIIGNLHMLGKLPHRTLHALSQKYGPLMFMRLGSVPTIVVSSPDMAKEFLKTRDLVFASRPPMAAARNILYNCTDVGFVPYGHYWRQMRKLCVLQLLSAKRVESFQSVRAEEVFLMINSILQDSRKGLNPVNVSKAVSSLTADIMCRITLGRKYATESFGSGGFKALLTEYFFLLGAFNIGDFLPWLERMDLQGLHRRQMKLHKTLDAFVEKIIKEHAGQNYGLGRDFVDVLLVAISEDNEKEMEITGDNMKAILLEMLAAGTDTSTGVLEWAMSALLKSPSVMKKAQEELEEEIGVERMVRESDLPNLKYLQSVVKETLRLYPPAPLLVHRESMETCTVAGYEIPAKARVIVNAWGIARDPKVWEDAEMFQPERFMGSCIDVKGQNFEVIPFGSGRRMCPGIQLATVVVELALAQLLHCFDWRLPDGMNAGDLKMNEEFGLTTPRAHPLVAVPTPRLQIERFKMSMI